VGQLAVIVYILQRNAHGLVLPEPTVLLVSCLALAAIGATAAFNGEKGIWVAAGAVLALFLLVLIIGSLLVAFAYMNPQAALYEGAELLLHEQIKQLGMKGHPLLPFDPATLTNPPSLPQPVTGPEGAAK
jgi:hypothetical protein